MAKISLQTGDSFITISGPSTILPSSSKITGDFKIILGTSTATADLSKIGKAAASTVVEIHAPSTDYHEVISKGYVYVLAGTSADLKSAVVKLPIAKKADSTAVKLHFNDYKTDVTVTKAGALDHAPDGTTAVTLTASPASIDEGQSVTYTATLASPAPVGGVSVPYTLSGISMADFGLTSLTGKIAIAAGKTTGTLVLNAVADNVTEGLETLSVALQAAPRIELGATTTASTTIVDTSKNPVLPTVTLTADVTAVDETAPNNVVTYTATLSSPATSVLNIPYTLGGTAGAADYTTTSTGTISIGVGATKGTLKLTTVADTTTEGSETVTVALNNTVSGVTVNTAAVATTINDTSLTPVLLPVGTTAAGTTTLVTATATAESFSLNVAAAKASMPNTQDAITGFDVTKDVLSLSGTGITPGAYTLANVLSGITTSVDGINNQTLVTFGPDANTDAISLTLVGVSTAANLVNVTIVS